MATYEEMARAVDARGPLAYEAAKNIYTRLQLQTQPNNEYQFLGELSLFHEKSPSFAVELLKFLDFCDNFKQPNYSFLELNLGQD